MFIIAYDVFGNVFSYIFKDIPSENIIYLSLIPTVQIKAEKPKESILYIKKGLHFFEGVEISKTFIPFERIPIKKNFSSLEIAIELTIFTKTRL